MKSIFPRSALRPLLAAAAMCLVIGPGLALAQDWPARPVRFVVPFATGGSADVFGRVVATRLQETLGQSFVVENRPGAGTSIGTEAVAKSAPDGQTIGMVITAYMINPSLQSKLPFDTLKDLVNVTQLVTQHVVLVANPKVPFNTVAELVAYAKKNPGKLNWGYPGAGTSQHLTGELFKFRAGLDITGVLYKGSGPMMTDLLGGQIGIAVDSLASALPQIKSGKVRPLAMTVAQRVPQLPEVPTVAELGYPGFDGAGWAGLVAPRGTPREVVERINAAANKALADPALRDRIIERGAIPDPRGPREFGDFVAAEIVKWGEIVKRANLKAE